MNIKDWAETIQALITAIGIIAAGIWSYYVFVLGRTFSPNLQIKLSMKQIVTYSKGSAAIFSIEVHNTGKTRVAKKKCYIFSSEVEIEAKSNELSRLDKSLNYENAKLYEIFENHSFLEPNEIAIEDALININNLEFLKVGMLFFDKKNKLWSSTSIFHIEK